MEKLRAKFLFRERIFIFRDWTVLKGVGKRKEKYQMHFFECGNFSDALHVIPFGQGLSFFKKD